MLVDFSIFHDLISIFDHLFAKPSKEINIEKDPLAYSADALIDSAVWSVDAEIEIEADILKWINDRLESLMDSGVTEVNAVQGQALAEFIKQNQTTGKYTEVTLEQLDSMNNSVILLAVQNDGIIIDEQMIRSTGGLSQNAKNQFQGQPVLKIKIPVVR